MYSKFRLPAILGILSLSILFISITTIADPTLDKQDRSTFTAFDVPTIEDQFFSDHVCNLLEERQLEITAFDPDGDLLTYELLSGAGVIDPQSGIISYTPDTSGVFIFEVKVSDSEGSATAFVYDTLVLNSLPQIYCEDSLVVQCAPEEICFYTYAHDPDGDPVTLFDLEGIGTFEQIDDSTARTCFTPADLDSADYLFIVRAADDCILNPTAIPGMSAAPAFNPCCRDTSLITVLIDVENKPDITCAEDFVFDDTSSTEQCFDITFNNSQTAGITLSIIEGDATINGLQICFIPDSYGQTKIVIEALNECGRSDTCEVNITVKRPETGEAYFDIKPTSCPNPLNMKSNNSRGGSMLPTAILGTEDFDVRDIDPESIMLEGITPVRYDYEDVTAPIDREDSCDCTEEGLDGYEDMTLKFNKSDIINLLSHPVDGSLIKLIITFSTYDGTEYSAYDCMIIRSRFSADQISSDILTDGLKLIGNQPNPFNPTTVISFSLPQSGMVKLEVINIAGQIIETLVNSHLEAGIHSVEWNAGNMSSGIYLYRLEVGEFSETKKMLLLK